MPLSEETKKKISEKLKGRTYERALRTCEKCGVDFKNDIKKGRPIRCKDCRRKVVREKENGAGLLDLSSRTVTKILKRSKIGCAICGWNESTCDIHHIVERSKGGTNELNNLICVCPNHHRVIHNEAKFSIEELQSMSLEKTLPNWREFYNV
jgi:DNA-directed RNA polymerase subunit RPC12/RpoP